MSGVRVAMTALCLLLPCASFAAGHSDDWCADAVDFAMGAAQNRELGYTREIILGSVERNPVYYQRMFSSLSVGDLQDLTRTVFDQDWTRFAAARGIAETCVVE